MEAVWHFMTGVGNHSVIVSLWSHPDRGSYKGLVFLMAKGLFVCCEKTHANRKFNWAKIMEESWLLQSWHPPFSARRLGHFLSLMFKWVFTNALMLMLMKRKNCYSLGPYIKCVIPSLLYYPGVVEHLGGGAYRKEMKSLVVCTWRRFCNPDLSFLLLFPEKLPCYMASCHAST